MLNEIELDKEDAWDGPSEEVLNGKTAAIKQYVASCIRHAKSDDWFHEDQQVAQALVNFYDAYFDIPQEEYLWYRFLREQVGMALITPDDIEYASPPPKRTRRGRPMKRYYKQFREWLLTLGICDEFVHDWYVRPGDKVLLVETEIVLGRLIDGHTSRGLPKSIAIWKYRASVSLTDGERLSQINSNGPSGETVLEFIESSSLAEIGEAIFSWRPLVREYARRGYAPVTVLPAEKLTGINRILVIPGIHDELGERTSSNGPEFSDLNPEKPVVKVGHDGDEEVA